MREAASKGADVILPSELFEGHYFCTSQEERNFDRAHPWRESPAVIAMAKLAAELGVVIPVSIFEKAGPAYFNSVVMVGCRWLADSASIASRTFRTGRAIRKNTISAPAIPASACGTRRRAASASASAGTSGFPETARAMALMGADVLLYPTAIGSEPHDDSLDTAARWRRAMLGHAVSNVTPVAAANRVGDGERTGVLRHLVHLRSHWAKSSAILIASRKAS